MSAKRFSPFRTQGQNKNNKNGEHTHQSREALEGSWDTDVRVDLDEDILGSVDIHLQETSLVQRTVQKGKKTLQFEKRQKEARAFG